jgi:hypothetical protein
MRFRMGDEAKAEGDAIWGRYNSDIVLDHCSMSWSTDECASFYANRNFTMQWCLITESLRSSVHGKGNHGYGGIWGGRNASFHHNMLSCHDRRNPRIDHPEIYDTYLATHRGNVDLRNNVIYNWGSNSAYGGEGGSFNVVGNYYKPGPASKERNYFVDAYNKTSSVVYDYPRLYMSGNYHAGSPTLAQSGWVYWHQGGSAPLLDGALPIRADDTKACYVTTHEAAVAFERVTGYAGASKVRDAVDVRAVDDARGGKATFPSGGNGSTGGIIDTQSAVGGWPTYSAGTKIADSDGDGMSDEWETLCGLDPSDAADGKTMTIDTAKRYTNLELYLHYLVQDAVLAQCANGNYMKLE